MPARESAVRETNGSEMAITFLVGSDSRVQDSLFFFTCFLWSLVSSQFIAQEATFKLIRGSLLNWFRMILNSSVIRLGSAYIITRSNPLCKLSKMSEETSHDNFSMVNCSC